MNKNRMTHRKNNQVNKIIRTRIMFFGFHSNRDYFLPTPTNNPEAKYPD